MKKNKKLQSILGFGSAAFLALATPSHALVKYQINGGEIFPVDKEYGGVYILEKLEENFNGNLNGVSITVDGANEATLNDNNMDRFVDNLHGLHKDLDNTYLVHAFKKNEAVPATVEKTSHVAAPAEKQSMSPEKVDKVFETAIANDAPKLFRFTVYLDHPANPYPGEFKLGLNSSGRNVHGLDLKMDEVLSEINTNPSWANGISMPDGRYSQDLIVSGNRLINRGYVTVNDGQIMSLGSSESNFYDSVCTVDGKSPKNGCNVFYRKAPVFDNGNSSVRFLD